MRRKSLDVKSKKQDKSIFDLENIHDLPDECKKEIERPSTGYRFQDKTLKLLQLFKYKSPLSVQEMVAGMFRLNKIVVTRQWVCTTADNLVTKKIIQKASKGVYKNVLDVPHNYRNLV